MKAPVGRVYFIGEHTSEHYNGYVHGAYLAGIHSAEMMIDCIKKGMCRVKSCPRAHEINHAVEEEVREPDIRREPDDC
ncbi:Polyamine oxidase [Acorus calamus]|uniref:Polyamine oxidase n=1 Tax=Acorus calamus TaxID=4465 RepID=A0AAV9ETZ0_ACOCL|nr:Polyamine oxidase [Acorus calamus]